MTDEIELLRSCFVYDPESGELRWRIQRGHNKKGIVAGSFDRHGYRKVICHGKTYLVHRVAWMIFYGEKPPMFLDHINRNRLDNRICNLRPSNCSQNSANIVKTKSQSGFRGVSRLANGKYKATISHCRKVIHLGTFKTPEAAWERYREASIRIKGEYSPYSPLHTGETP